MAVDNKQLIEYAAKRSDKISKLFDKFIFALLQANIRWDELPADDIFRYSKYPEAAKYAEKVAGQLRDALRTEFLNAIKGSIALAIDTTQKEFEPFTNMDDDALDKFRSAVTEAFINSRVKPDHRLSLSDRVWNYTQQSKAEFELGLSQVLEDGIRRGESAEVIGRKVRNKLRNPDMMYRRYHLKKVTSSGKVKDVVEWRRKVVDKDGKVKFVKEDLAKVGRGVCRSARQNALRMVSTEITSAYRYADNMRYQKEPFVLGYRIQLSNNHTCKDSNGIPRPFHDMCDDLQGLYPKWFLWQAWHPRCRCFMTAVLCSEEEMRKISTLPKEEYDNYVSPNAIKDMPKEYYDYINNNADRLNTAIENGKQPYWIRDNYVDGDLSAGFTNRTAPIEIMPVPTQEKYANQDSEELRRYKIQKAAEERHAKRDKEDIQRRWDIDRIKAWEFKVDYYEDSTNLTPEYVRKNINWVKINIIDRHYPKEVIDRWDDIAIMAKYDRLCEEANGKLGDFALKSPNTAKKKALALLRKYPDMPARAVARLKQYLYNSNENKEYNYLARIKQNIKGIDNLGVLLAKDVNFDEFSPNMPAVLLPDSDEYDMHGHKLDKRLFDTLDYFVECKVGDKKDCSYFDKAKHHVFLKKSQRRGEFHDIQVIYHEYGHAIDYMDDAINSAVDNLMTLFRQEMDDEDYEALDKTLKDQFYKHYSDLKTKESVMAIMDIVQALTGGRYGCTNIDGHELSYWRGDQANEARHTEFFAHMSEVFFLGNEMLLKLYPHWHKKMKELFENIVKK